MKLTDSAITSYLTAMRTGKSVLIVTALAHDAHQAFLDLATHTRAGERTRATNGDQEIRTADNRGRIRIRTATSGHDRALRGLSVDLAVVDADCSVQARESARLAAATGEFVLYMG